MFPAPFQDIGTDLLFLSTVCHAHIHTDTHAGCKQPCELKHLKLMQCFLFLHALFQQSLQKGIAQQ